MTDSVSANAVAAATAYEQLHVPALFRQWAARVLAAAQVRPGDRVLDVACGTGILAREAAGAVGRDGFVAGLDATAAMLVVAQSLNPAVQWRHGVAESLPYEEASFDAVVSQFGLMFFTDRPRAVREMMRVLTPHGRLAIAVWAALEESEAYPDVVALLDRIAGRQAADALRAPFGLGDREALRLLFEDAGAKSVDVATHRGTAQFPSIRMMVEADLRGWLPVMGVVLAEEQIDQILAESEHLLRRYRSADGTVRFDAPAHIVAAAKS